MLTFARRLTMFALLATTTVLGGCGDDDPSGPSTISGTYELQVVNGQTLPYTVFDDPTFGKLEILASTLTFNADRTWDEITTTRTTEGDAEPVVEEEPFGGTYTRDGNSLTMSDGDESLVAVIQSNGDIVLSGDGFSFRYVEQ